MKVGSGGILGKRSRGVQAAFVVLFLLSLFPQLIGREEMAACIAWCLAF